MNEELKIIISAEIDKLKQGVQNAKKEIEDLSKKSKMSAEDIDKSFKNIGTKATNAMKTAGTAIAGTITALGGLSVATAEYRANQAKLTSAFETAGASAETAKETYNDLYRVLGDGGQATEAANHLAKLTTNEKELSEWTNICQGVYATFGDSLPIESLTEAANETAKTGSLTGALADALNWAGISEDDFQAKLDACNTEAEREHLIRSTLNKTYEDAAAKYEKNAADTLAQNEAQAKLSETMAKLGAVVAPIVTLFTQFATEALAVVTPYIQKLAEKYGPALSEVLKVVAEAVGSVFGFLVEHTALLGTIAGIIGGIVTAIGLYNAVAAIKAAMDAAQVTTLGALAASYLAQAAAMAVAIAPYALIVAAIAAVIAIIVLCIKHWDEIKEAVANAWEWIKEKTAIAVEAVTNFFTNMRDRVVEIAHNLGNLISEKFEEIKNNLSEKVSAAKDKVVEVYGQMKENMGIIMQAAKETVDEKLNNIKTAYEEHGGGVKGIAAAYIEAVKGFYSAGFTFIDKLTNGKLTDIANTMKSKMDEAKQNVSRILDNIKQKFSDIIEKAKSIVQSGVDKIKSAFNFEWKLPHIRLPHFSISGEFSLNPPSIPHFSVDWYKLGGVFDQPTLFAYGNRIGGLGEDGAEAIVPLEKNTQWLDKLAEKLAAKQGNTPVILQVDGKTLAKTTIDSINSLTRQTGKFPFKLA